MDNRNGEFKDITPEHYDEQMKLPEPMVFKVGEVIKIRGSRLRVEKIYKKKITFKLLPELKGFDKMDMGGMSESGSNLMSELSKLKGEIK